MAMREFELKFAWPGDAAQAADLARALALDNAPGKQVYSAYFDTADRQLAQARGAFRVRKVGDGWVQTIKGEGRNPFERFEHETAIASAAPCRQQLPAADSAAIAACVHQVFGQLQPVFETDFIRVKRKLGSPQLPASLGVELAWDQGEVRASGRTTALNELELELLHGSQQQLLRRARALASRFQLSLRQTSKAQLGARLAGEERLTTAVEIANKPTRRAGGPLAGLALLAYATALTKVLLLHEAEREDPCVAAPPQGCAAARELANLLRQMLRVRGWPGHVHRDIQLLAARLAHGKGALTPKTRHYLSVLIIDLAWHDARRKRPSA